MTHYYKSLCYAVEGIWHAFTTERNLKLFVTLYLLSLIISAFLHIFVRDWEMVILSGGLFIAVELVNTALERFADAFYQHAKSQNDLHTRAIKATKDIAAGASLVCAIGWIVILIMIFSPHVWLWLHP